MTTPSLDTAWHHLEAGDPHAVLRELRGLADDVPAAQVASLVQRLAADSGFDDLADAAGRLAAGAGGPVALYKYGYACVERGVSYLAAPALAEGLGLAAAEAREGEKTKRGLFGRSKPRPDSRLPILSELATALEDEERHAEAAAVLREHEPLLRDWPGRYLLAYNALMSGDRTTARATLDRLSAPDDQWRPAADRVRRALDRADAVEAGAGAGSAEVATLTPTPLSHQDLRGWHFALTGGLLATLSPYGFAAGMTGRYAFLQDSYGLCRHGLERLRLVLDATGTRPRSVSLLPGRADRALGLAAAELFGLPAESYRPGTGHTLVVAYDLNDVDGIGHETLAALRERATGEVLYEHATCWTDTPPVTADVSGLLGQTVAPPWRMLGDEPDERPAEALAAEIVAADPTQDEGDGDTPPDPDDALTAFARVAREHWLNGPRDRCRSSGPVPSSRFR
ncbi:hypothetical protein KV557_08945 [Kitasatospora aureofaciens]|uniref:hypothetical protein n=1 Tax=Kitasatospora aureofaciens TaxID=1894 RepID=UPI001C456360|nr:hypothetical protein [Kitasatospora aureofaciens]MBV6697248.1 hypothetical protein [Kitasatospora aureofaciens]